MYSVPGSFEVDISPSFHDVAFASFVMLLIMNVASLGIPGGSGASTSRCTTVGTICSISPRGGRTKFTRACL